MEDYLNEAFRDGLIEEAEAKAIETYINQIQSEKAGVEATYNKLYVNPILKEQLKQICYTLRYLISEQLMILPL